VTFTAFVVEVTAEEVDPLADALLDAGALSVSCEDARAEPAAEAPHFDGSGESVSWARVRLTALCKAQPEPEQLLLRACNRAGIAVPIHELHSVPDEDWVAKSREQFAPIQISAHLWILPTWRAAPEPYSILGSRSVPALTRARACACSGSSAALPAGKRFSTTAAVPVY